MKTKALSFYVKVLSFLLVLFGFQSCYPEPTEPEQEPRIAPTYGVPAAEFKVKLQDYNGGGGNRDEGEATKNIEIVDLESVKE